LVLSAVAARGEDWPQWMGPKRDNVIREEGLIDKIPADGPKVLWRTPIKAGYAGPAVVKGKVYVSDYATAVKTKEGNFDLAPTTGSETVMCLNAANGEVVWKHSYPAEYRISYPSGPRCTPTVHEGKVYFLGAVGHLLCCDAEKGDILWQKNLAAEYKTKPALWGYAGHPLIDGKKLITLAGGDGSHVVALDKDTGKEIWKSQSQEEQGYVPPSIIEAGGVRQLLAVGPKAVRALDPETGKRLWSADYEATSGSIIMTPIKSGNLLFVAGYSNKSLLLKLSTEKPEAVELWRDKKGAAMSPVNVQPFLDGEVLYGFDQSGEMIAMELATGKRLWTSTAPLVEGKVLGSGTAFIYKNGDRFFLFNDLGELIICKLSPQGYEEVSRSKPLLEKTGKGFGRDVVWCAPAFADKKLFVRNDKEIICMDLAK
jgi:outer membrane protein assembly factor BamB